MSFIDGSALIVGIFLTLSHSEGYGHPPLFGCVCQLFLTPSRLTCPPAIVTSVLLFLSFQ